MEPRQRSVYKSMVGLPPPFRTAQPSSLSKTFSREGYATFSKCGTMAGTEAQLIHTKAVPWLSLFARLPRQFTPTCKGPPQGPWLVLGESFPHVLTMKKPEKTISYPLTTFYEFPTPNS